MKLENEKYTTWQVVEKFGEHVRVSVIHRGPEGLQGFKVSRPSR
jgi:hypothetical protein